MLGGRSGRGSKMNQNLVNPVFVVGALRSGTSLLYSLLNQHSQVALMYEADIWNFPAFLSGPRFRGSWLARQEFFNQVLSRHRLIFGDSTRGLEEVRKPEDLYRVFSRGKSASLWGEKSPLYGTHLRRLARHYPNASFILIWRNPVETYRSIVLAGRKSLFFRQRGMLSRLIYYQEEMVRQAVELKSTNARVCHVDYDELVSDPKKVCSRLCDFLEINFDEKMLDLAGADLSAVHRAPQHDHLRSGKIERRQLSEKLLNESAVRKLHRFQNRWRRLSGQQLPPPPEPRETTEPRTMDLLYHRMLGSALNKFDSIKRVLFEFLPLNWLKTYRLVKTACSAPNHAAPASPRLQGKQSIGYILGAYFILAGIATLDFLCGPHLTLAPFYLLPAMLLTSVVSRKCGTITAIISSVVWSAMQAIGDPEFASQMILIWNSLMRFVCIEVVVILVGHYRLKASQSAQ